MSSIEHEVESGVGIIRLNRPEVFNSFNREMAIAFQDILDVFEETRAVRAIYITGVGKAFCAGQDLVEATDAKGPKLQTIVRQHYNPIIERLRNIEKPIVSAVNGVAAGAGANIALACDICVATESASFIQAFSKIGLIPDSGGTFILPRLIGMQKATALMMLGDKVSAKDAEQMGMIYKWFADATFAEDSLNLAKTLASMPTRGLGLTKKALNLSTISDLSAQLETEEEFQTIAGSTYDYNEGVAAFLEKRKPVFKGE
ncbi:MAG: enoyl-CoA hydratase/isomerase family protein [Crocinitomicaceae bacterium]|jgi:2-(1,2-epoxy-1,2-dihydrophenyl)acetyl-CoA isomerase|nr:enoyl-CoA hydratase/isomerase family protein [Crocinitomicaceae bacterium]